MTWKEFLAQIRGATQITLVGPLYDRPFEPGNPTIFVDGGANFRAPVSAVPVLTVGDGDSTTAPMDVRLAQDKDVSDLGAVLRELPQSIQLLEMYGFLGGRRDHELLNLGEVHHFLCSRAGFTSVRFGPQLTAFVGGALTMRIHGTFSVVVFEDCTAKIEGACAFPLDAPLKAVSSLGLSNRGSGQVTIQATKPCFVFTDI